MNDGGLSWWTMKQTTCRGVGSPVYQKNLPLAKLLVASLIGWRRRAPNFLIQWGAVDRRRGWLRVYRPVYSSPRCSLGPGR